MVERDERKERKLSYLKKLEKRERAVKIIIAVASSILVWIVIFMQINNSPEGVENSPVSDILNFIITLFQ